MIDYFSFALYAARIFFFKMFVFASFYLFMCLLLWKSRNSGIICMFYFFIKVCDFKLVLFMIFMNVIFGNFCESSTKVG